MYHSLATLKLDKKGDKEAEILVREKGNAKNSLEKEKHVEISHPSTQ